MHITLMIEFILLLITNPNMHYKHTQHALFRLLFVNGVYTGGMGRDTVEKIISKGDTMYTVLRTQGIYI